MQIFRNEIEISATLMALCFESLKVGDRNDLVEAIIDQNEPPRWAKIPLDQASTIAQSLPKGEPNPEKIARTVLGDKLRASSLTLSQV
jgi:hypothetical protein